MEYFVKKGIFLAPKSYYLLTTEDRRIIKHKGLAKSLVDEKWFESQYAELSKTKLTPIVSNFQIDWVSLNIMKKEKLVKLGTKVDTKRNPVFDNNQIWVDTAPFHVTDYAGQDKRVLKYEVKCLQIENSKLKSIIDSIIKEDDPQKQNQGSSPTRDIQSNPKEQMLDEIKDIQEEKYKTLDSMKEQTQTKLHYYKPSKKKLKLSIKRFHS